MQQAFTDSDSIRKRYQDTVQSVHTNMRQLGTDYMMIQRNNDTELRNMSYTLGLTHLGLPEFVFATELSSSAQVRISDMLRDWAKENFAFIGGEFSREFNHMWNAACPNHTGCNFRVYMSKLNTEQFLYGHGMIAAHYFPKDTWEQLDFRQIIFGDSRGYYPWEAGYSQMDTPQDVFPVFPFGDRRNKQFDPKHTVDAHRLKYLN